MDNTKIRSEFPLFKSKINGKTPVYFDSAATSLKPKTVIDALNNYYQNLSSNIHRSANTLSHESSLLYDNAHEKIAAFIGAENWRDIVFTRNATESINLVAYSWGLQNLKENDEILISVMEHHSNIVPWQMLEKVKGVKIKYLDVNEDGTLKLEELPKLLTDRTKLVGIIHASNVLGTVNPVKEIVKEAKKVGALVLVDAAQSVPHIKIDITDIGCDFLVGSGHKMVGPTGIGFLYGREELLDNMQPFLYGGDMIETVTLEKSTWNELPWKFEAGTPNIAGGIGLGAAVDYLNEIGLENISKYEKELLTYALDKLTEYPWIKVYGPEELERIGVISFNVDGVHPHDVSWILDNEGIEVRSGNHCAQPLMRRLGIENAVRVSFYVYNTKEEIDKLIDTLIKTQELLKV
ncbi:MAG: aminotransferase class V-fold PLP-dependent enzyme [Thermodesulfobacteriota bacterium]